MFLKHFSIFNSNLLLKSKRRKISQKKFTVANYLFNISLSGNCNSIISNSTNTINNFSSINNSISVISNNSHSSFDNNTSSYNPSFHLNQKNNSDHDHTNNAKKPTLNKFYLLKKLHHDISKLDMRVVSNFKIKKKITNYYKAKVKKKGSKINYIYLKYISHLKCYVYNKKYFNIQKLLHCIKTRRVNNLQKIDAHKNLLFSNQVIIHEQNNIGKYKESEYISLPVHNNLVKVLPKSIKTSNRNCRKKKRENDTEERERKTKRDRQTKIENFKNSKKNVCNENRDKNKKDGNDVKDVIEKEKRSIDEKTEAKNIKMNDLLLVGLSGCIPFICFGFVDNSFMIIAGDLFDSTFCIYLGFSTMAAAGLGNLTSDVLGIFLGGYIEKLIAHIGFPKINMTNKQLKMNRTRRYYYLGSAVGIAIGCLLGMIPLLFLDSNKLEGKKKDKMKKPKNANKALFDLVSKELPQHINSNHAFLFIVDKTKNMFYSYLNNERIRLDLNNDCVLAEVYSKGKTIAYEINNQLINTTYLFKPNINQEEEKVIQSGWRNKENEKEAQIIESTNSFFSKHKIDVKKILATPLFGLDQSVIGVIVVINPKNNFCSDSKYIHFLNLLCSHISHEVKEDTDISKTLQLCKKVVYG